MLAVDVRNATGVYGSYGLVFGLSDDFSQFYDFEIDPLGNYAIYRYGSGTFTLLVQDSSGSIHTGTATNRLWTHKIRRSRHRPRLRTSRTPWMGPTCPP